MRSAARSAGMARSSLPESLATVTSTPGAHSRNIMSRKPHCRPGRVQRLFGGGLSAIARTRNPLLEFWAQVGFLHKAILPTVNGPELVLRRDLEVIRLQVAKAHHTAK